MKAKVGNVRLEMYVNYVKWKLSIIFPADGTELLAENERGLTKVGK